MKLKCTFKGIYQNFNKISQKNLKGKIQLRIFEKFQDSIENILILGSNQKYYHNYKTDLNFFKRKVMVSFL